MNGKIQVYNTMSGKKEAFEPLSAGKVNMYVCGITPYDTCHIGHARCYTVFDVIRRYLQYRGYSVNYVQNFTDIDDKIIDRSAKLNIPPGELAEKYIQEFFFFCDKLNIKRADKYPRVTEHIPQIISSIEKLVQNGSAYVSGGNVYFSVRKFSGYGKLSKRNIDELLTGVRVQPEEDKKEPLDFALWKSQRTPQEPAWDSPWGKGRPGWHIECTVMSTCYLADTLDIHGGGQDLIFPHHENEIAQSESLTGKIFAKYWIHNGFVTVNAEKMSKSLGNFFSVKDILEKYSPVAVRYFLLTQQYRKPIDFSDEKLKQAKSSVERIELTLKNIADFLENNSRRPGDIPAEFPAIEQIAGNFETAMDDDFNTELALSFIHELCSLANSELNRNSGGSSLYIGKCKDTLDRLLGGIMGIDTEHSYAQEIPEELKKKIEALILQRQEARTNKEWQKSDSIRKQLLEMNVIVEDTRSGQRWYLKR